MRKKAFQKKMKTARMRWMVCCSFLLAGVAGYAQDKDPLLSDTTVYDYDEIFSELDLLLDSLYTPRSFLVANVTAGNGFFQYASASNRKAGTRQQLIFSPAVGYFHKSGFGLNAGSSIIHDSSRLLPFQFSLTGSFDYLRNTAFLAGASYTRFFTKEDLSFYTSPLQNELYGYFTYRGHWLKPSIAASYGWGSRSAVEERTTFIEQILDKVTRNNGNSGNGNGNNGNSGNGNGNGNNGNGNSGNTGNTGNGSNGSPGDTITGSETTVIKTHETIADLSLMVSVRRDFYFLHLLSNKDYVRLTPQLTFTSGTQQFGFNSLSNSYLTVKDRSKNINVITGQQDVALEDRLHFQPLSLTAQVRTEYSTGKFFVQPQLYVDYYFPAPEKNITTSFLISAGVIF